MVEGLRNIACNLIYNNGDENIYVGFKSRCNIQNIIYNVELDDRRWCSQIGCSCRRFYDNNFEKKFQVEEYPCTESYLFEGWEWNPGSEFKTGKPFRVLQSGAGKFAILTTRFANQPEEERKIVGFLKIRAITDNYHRVIGIKKQSLRLTLDEAKELNFWNYHRNTKSLIPMWRQGRFRYLDDEQVVAILYDLKAVLQNEGSQSMIGDLLSTDFANYAARPEVVGALQEEVTKKVLLKRKYGKGGESKAHKDLKEFIAKNPQSIGLQRSKVKAQIEHLFVSGDLVDILFEGINDSIDTVVEIELDNVMPGIHQAIKYRALRCSQMGLALDDKSVKATVVAWHFSDEETQLCKKYDIQYFIIRL